MIYVLSFRDYEEQRGPVNDLFTFRLVFGPGCQPAHGGFAEVMELRLKSVEGLEEFNATAYSRTHQALGPAFWLGCTDFLCDQGARMAADWLGSMGRNPLI